MYQEYCVNLQDNGPESVRKFGNQKIKIQKERTSWKLLRLGSGSDCDKIILNFEFLKLKRYRRGGAEKASPIMRTGSCIINARDASPISRLTTLGGRDLEKNIS